jgi:hypothetical protein
VYGGGGRDAQKLYSKLFKNYNKEVRPVNRNSDSLEVDFGLALLEILDLDDNGRMELSTWLRMVSESETIYLECYLYGLMCIGLDQMWWPELESPVSSSTCASLIP